MRTLNGTAIRLDPVGWGAAALDRPRGATLSDWCGEAEEFGVLYLALGRPYVAMALTSALSLRLTNPSVPFTILTDTSLDESSVKWFGPRDRIVDMTSTLAADTSLSPGVDGRSALTRKPLIYSHARHERMLFIDADTLVLGDLEVIDQSLRHFDILARPYLERGVGRYATKALHDTGLTLGEAVSCNTGVIAFRKGEPVEEFFITWSSTIDEIGIDNDQPPFVPALYASPKVRFFPLPRRFNEGAPSAIETDDIAILHYKRRGDRTTRRLVEDVAVRTFGDSATLRKDVQSALLPGKSKRRQRAYRRSRNQDRFRRSIVAPIRETAEARGWL